MNFRGLIAGLGNPGRRYAGTLHNCGFMFADKLLALAERDGQADALPGKKFHAELWKIALPQLDGAWLLAKPQTYMNESGQAIQPLLAWYRLPPSSLLVIQDEMDIPPGTLRFKFGGGLAGHNGLLSISKALGTQDFYRLRIGVGKPSAKEQVLDWVLGRPQTGDRQIIEAAMDIGLETLFIFSHEGLQAAIQHARSARADI